jgi:DNA-binding transcriptional regulator YiaG
MAKPKKNPWPASRIKALRAKLGLTQAQFAERIGVSTAAVITWENEQRVPGRIALRLISQAFPNE